MTRRTALGFKLHTGWAVLVAVSGRPGAIEVRVRRRIELVQQGSPIPRFVYHAASELPLKDAAEIVRRGREAAEQTARQSVEAALQALHADGVTVDVCGVLSGSTVVPDDLAAIVRAHPMIHAAEGLLFQNAIVSACEQLEIPVITVRERDVWARASASAGVPEVQLRAQVDAVRKMLGPPWTADHKIATAAAMIR